jgi:hypothetical protein
LSGHLIELLEKNVLLLETKPELLFLDSIEDLLGYMAEIGVGRINLFVKLILPFVSVAKNNIVSMSSEGVLIELTGLENDFRLVDSSLVSLRSIVIPIWEIFDSFRLLVENSGFRSSIHSSSINPYVLHNRLSVLA